MAMVTCDRCGKTFGRQVILSSGGYTTIGAVCPYCGHYRPDPVKHGSDNRYVIEKKGNPFYKDDPYC